MNTDTAVNALKALAQDTRISVFRLLVEAGPPGLPAGEISRRLKIAPGLMTFHLNHLVNACLVASRRSGRQIIYTVNFAEMDSLMEFLTENCCAGMRSNHDEPVAASLLVEPEGDNANEALAH